MTDPNRPLPFFVGGHLALDFLNTTARPQGALIEWLEDGNDFLSWLQQAGSIDPAAAAKIRAFGGHALDESASKARQFRNWLRRFVTARMGSPLTPPAAKALGPVNLLLAVDGSYPVVEAAAGALRLRRVRRWEGPDELLQLIAESVADLICNEDFHLIRACEGQACTLLFLDRTKAHARRWCSMAVCGNRAKAAAHRARKNGH